MVYLISTQSDGICVLSTYPFLYQDDIITGISNKDEIPPINDC